MTEILAPKLYQDRLYGSKVLSPLAIKIIDSAEFQRLSGLRQLGFADIVYRGAVHSRFEHSVGVHFICRTILRRIVQNHERLDFPHPGSFISEKFALYPQEWIKKEYREKLIKEAIGPSYQACWRGLTEAISAAALIHDITNAPFGHTLEDEFTGIYERHDSLASPRLHEMLFNPSSELAGVFSDEIYDRWIPGISNHELRCLLYVTLSWKEKIEPPMTFNDLLDEQLKKAESAGNEGLRARLNSLKEWHLGFLKDRLFHPFYSDIIGNTICADLIDYLPRDRTNLGMEARRHERLLRYLTIRPGQHHPEHEGLRLSILVTRKGRGGQRKDVATTVLDMMRERYQMAERVYYHHKKAAASAMLAKLVELSGKQNRKPRDDEHIYPAPWGTMPPGGTHSPHILHFTDIDFIEYLRPQPNARISRELALIQNTLYLGLRHSRKSIYRTLLVIDTNLVRSSPHEVSYFISAFRSNDGRGRIALERFLAKKVLMPRGTILIYCPSIEMQAKEVDVRMELKENAVLPLRVQKDFTYVQDLEALNHYYRELWRAYIFVDKSIYDDASKCKKIVDEFCTIMNIDKDAAYAKVRGHQFQLRAENGSRLALENMGAFISDLPVEGIPKPVFRDLANLMARDERCQAGVLAVDSLAVSRRLRILLQVVTVKNAMQDKTRFKLSAKQAKTINEKCDLLLSEQLQLSAHERHREESLREKINFEDYQREIMAELLSEEAST